MQQGQAVAPESTPNRPRLPRSRILGGIGRTCIAIGTFILLFVVYQLWGTAIHEARAQRELTREFDELLARSGSDREPTRSSTPSTHPGDAGSPDRVDAVDPIPGWSPVEGEPVAKIDIPSIGIKRTVVEGDDDAQLKRGMGHLAITPLPGQRGNSAIAGHRTTYGQPLHNIDRIETGDLIHVETIQGSFTYEVTGSEIVKPEDTWVLDDRGRNELTLIACHPKYYLDERYILYAELVGKPTEDLPGQEAIRRDAASRRDAGEPGTGILDGSSGRSSARTPVILWFLTCAGIWLATWGVQVRLRRRLRPAGDRGNPPGRGQRLFTWSPYLIGVPAFLVALYFLFENFSLLLPGSY